MNDKRLQHKRQHVSIYSSRYQAMHPLKKNSIIDIFLGKELLRNFLPFLFGKICDVFQLLLKLNLSRGRLSFRDKLSKF